MKVIVAFFKVYSRKMFLLCSSLTTETNPDANNYL